jgi:2'-5' RNA ligase
VSDDTSWRLFVALPVPDHIRVLVEAATAPARDSAPELTWTRPGGWHVTLAFLGDVASDQVPDVEGTVGQAVAASDVGPLRCQLGEPDRFDTRVLFLTVEDDPAGGIADLGGSIQAAIEAAGLPVTRKPVHPHLTLARASRRGATVTDAVTAAVAPVTGEWEADEVVLVRSHLGGGPARYETVSAWTPSGPS